MKKRLKRVELTGFDKNVPLGFGVDFGGENNRYCIQFKKNATKKEVIEKLREFADRLENEY